ncbi:MAG: esterase-like activity of phytase family protein [Flavisolibacter sp.]
MKYTLPIVLIFFISCSTINNRTKVSNETKLRFIGKYELPHNMQFSNTTVGGLSGIDYDRKNDVYYLICDDGSRINSARFYKAKITITNTGIESVRFLEVKYLKQRNGNLYPAATLDPWNTPDPESIRIHPTKNFLLWGNEGHRIYNKTDTIISDPAVVMMDLEGNFVDSFSIPSNMHMRKNALGPRNNGSFEGITFTKNYKTLLVSMEEPLYEDGPRAGIYDSSAINRIIEFDMKNLKPKSQYAYRIEPVAIPPKPPGAFRINGISEILWINDDKILVVERSYSVGTKPSTIKIFLADLKGASEVSGYTSLENIPVNFISKKLLLNMDSLGIYVDNIEGITIGPVLPNGHSSVILVADNNFDEKEISQFFLFEIHE